TVGKIPKELQLLRNERHSAAQDFLAVRSDECQAPARIHDFAGWIPRSHVVERLDLNVGDPPVRLDRALVERHTPPLLLETDRHWRSISSSPSLRHTFQTVS